jgi:hypothetical protein
MDVSILTATSPLCPSSSRQPAFVQNLHQLLEGTIAPDTNVIKQVRPPAIPQSSR